MQLLICGDRDAGLVAALVAKLASQDIEIIVLPEITDKELELLPPQITIYDNKPDRKTPMPSPIPHWVTRRRR